MTGNAQAFGHCGSSLNRASFHRVRLVGVLVKALCENASSRRLGALGGLDVKSSFWSGSQVQVVPFWQVFGSRGLLCLRVL